jgi:hypothetical protein
MGRPGIVVQIIPTRTGAYIGLEGAFTLLSFAEASNVGYFEVASIGQLVE